MQDKEIKILSSNLKLLFHNVYEKIKNRKITDRSLDIEVLKELKNTNVVSKNLEIKFSDPTTDEIYNAEAGRTPYDLLCYGKINKKNFSVFINNKFGNLNSNTRNDVTTYNNLLRLYLGIKQQRLSSEITIDKKLIYKRVSGNDIVSYGVFVVDTKKKGFNFFLLEEIEDSFYVNPRNTMFQIKYNPKICTPLGYYTFMMKLIDATLEALNKNLNATQTEIMVLNTIKKQLLGIISNKKRT